MEAVTEQGLMLSRYNESKLDILHFIVMVCSLLLTSVYFETDSVQVAIKFEHRNSKGCNYGPPYEWQVYKYVPI